MKHSSTPAIPNRHDVEAYLNRRTCACDPTRVANMLHDNSRRDNACQFDERFLQALWNEQCFSQPLTTVDGRPLSVLTAGTWNTESGPDFKDAVIRIDGDTISGAVEIHRTNRDWWHHAHDKDLAYKGVVLHVVWEHRPHAQDTELPPCLVMRHHIGKPWQAISRELKLDSYPYARKVPPGLCSVQWVNMADEEVCRILRIAGMARMHEKTLLLQHEIIARGAEQCLYASLFEALGYKVNRQPFRQLAESVPIDALQQLSSGVQRRAALFGAAGLLPDLSTARVCRDMRAEVGNLWDAWWQLGRPKQKVQWHRGRTRPLNFPERRLAAGAAILDQSQCQPGRRLLDIAQRAESGRDLLKLLRKFLDTSGPWETYATFEKKLARPASLLGARRKDDIIVNTLLPFLRAQASMRGTEDLQERCDEAYVTMPRLQSNRLMKEISHRLFVPPSRARAVLRHACEQQGLLAIYQDFCLVAGNACENCPAGEPCRKKTHISAR